MRLYKYVGSNVPSHRLVAKFIQIASHWFPSVALHSCSAHYGEKKMIFWSTTIQCPLFSVWFIRKGKTIGKRLKIIPTLVLQCSLSLLSNRVSDLKARLDYCKDPEWRYENLNCCIPAQLVRPMDWKVSVVNLNVFERLLEFSQHTAPLYLLLPLGKRGSKWGDFNWAMGCV